MTDDKVQDVLLNFGSMIADSKKLQLKNALKNADDSRYDEVIYAKVKNPTTVTLLSIFVGALGVDRFYLGDIALGIVKLLFVLFAPIVVLFLTGSPTLYMIFLLVWGFAINIWWLVDIFLCRSKAKEYNFRSIMLLL